MSWLGHRKFALKERSVELAGEEVSVLAGKRIASPRKAFSERAKTKGFVEF
jgi:hypothetical protein